MSFDWHPLWESICAFFASESAPAWIQAVGSVLAVGLAIWISKNSINHAASEKRNTIFAIAEAAHTLACNIRKAVDAMEWSTGDSIQIYQVYDKVVIEGVVRALQGVPMYEVGSSKGVLAMLSLIDQMVFLGASIETLLQDPYQNPTIRKTLASFDKRDNGKRQKIAATAYSHLQNNVRKHLDIIDKNYESLKESMKS